MGYTKHNAVIVTDWNKGDIEKVHAKAIEIFKNEIDVEFSEKCISLIIKGLVNSYYSFFIAPDGSKEGWSIDKEAEEARMKFQNWLLESGLSEYIEICFGGDSDIEYIKRSKESDLNKQ
ncbi:hypothetical protein [Tenacibaculum aiptasiae]|uniref:hypothetical protein n=1 Tax=Tenacibaculum aiptasiae TaxID=426481 RepID=UPI003B5B652F